MSEEVITAYFHDPHDPDRIAAIRDAAIKLRELSDTMLKFPERVLEIDMKLTRETVEVGSMGGAVTRAPGPVFSTAFTMEMEVELE